MKNVVGSTLMKIENRRSQVLELLNRVGDEFPLLKKEEYYYNEKLKCWTTKASGKYRSDT